MNNEVARNHQPDTPMNYSHRILWYLSTFKLYHEDARDSRQLAIRPSGSPTTESKLSACGMLVDATHGTLMSVLYVYYGPYSYIALKKASYWRGPRYLKGGSGPHPRHGGCERSPNQTKYAYLRD